MEKLNEFLQALLSTRSFELHLEPGKIPYLVAPNGLTDAGTSALAGTQISMMVFPLIPNEVKVQLPGKQEIEFVHSNRMGNFSFLVKKSPGGFYVIVRPILTSSPARQKEQPAAVPATSAAISGRDPERPSPPGQKPSILFESASSAQENNAAISTGSIPPLEIEIEEPQPAAAVSFVDSKIEVLPVNSPEFATVFSETSTYEPPAKRHEFLPANSGHMAPQTGFAPPNESGLPAETALKAEIVAPAPTLQQPPVQQPPPAAPQPAPQLHAVTEAAPAAFAPAAHNPRARARMDDLFRKMAEIGASDLHMSVSMPPMVRKDGKMQTLPSNESVLTPESMRELLTSIMPARNQEEFAERNDTDFAYEIPELARFRANIFMDRKGMGGVFRIIPSKILTAEQLGLSSAIMDLCSLSKGLVVVTGPTGSGKSTTLCAMIDHINKNRDDHIITIEDPIEFVHENKQCLVNQREVGNHTNSFKNALRAALREDPDILLVGEMRDLETISIAIETAETGHLVFGTLHTTTAASTVDRIIDQFPADRQQQIRVMLSESLKGVIAQTLLPKKGGGRIAALEILIVTPAISNLIREGKTFQIPSAMQTGRNMGMVILNDALFNLVQKGIVEPRDAYIKAVDKIGFESMLKRAGFRI